MKLSLAELSSSRTSILIGISVAVGTLGGVYLLTKGSTFLSKIIDRKPKRKNTDRCNVCFEVLDLEDFKSCAACCNCGKSVCRGRKCSLWLPNQAGWECKLCNLSNESRSRASEWIQQQQAADQYLRPMSSKSEFYIPVRDRNGGSHLSVYDTRSEALSSVCPEQKEKVREYVEDILSNILGGPLDEISVGQLFKSREYLPLSGSQNDDEGVSHVKLKRLIEKIIDDVLHLPALIDQSGVPSRSEENLPPYFDPKKYQELLATAVLNKIVDTYNYEKSLGKPEKAPIADLDKNHNTRATQKEQGYSSSSSIEPHSDSSLTDPINIRRSGLVSPSDSCSHIFIDKLNQNVHEGEVILSDYLAKHRVPLPELSVESESAGEDLISVATSNGVEGSWEDNWLFKKKKHGHESPAPVGMLVPAPREDIRALIGDKTADEISDLSEAGSDFEEDDMDVNDVDDSLNPPNERVLNKHVIGGKSTIGLFDELLEETSLISTSSLQDNEPLYTDTKNDFVLGNDGLNDVEKPNINLCRGSMPIENEAVNSMVAAQILQGSPPKSILETTPITAAFEDSILAPPTEFIDLPNASYEAITDDTKEENMSEIKDLSVLLESVSPACESNGDKASLESNTTEGSTSTVIDTAEVQMQSKMEEVASDCQENQIINDDQNESSEKVTKDENNISAINNNTNPIPHSIHINALNDQDTTSKTILGAIDLEKPLKHLIPGSIAEREHKKWYNAVEMPNNPYSPEALIRRLSDGPEKPMDIPNINPVLDKTTSEESATTLKDNVNEELSVRLEAEKLDYKRYSRDYYINDAKHASGSRKYRSKLLQLNSFQSTSDSDKELNTSPTCEDKKTDNLGDIFLARPVRVEESDPILSKATKLEYLSTPERDFYLLPSEEAINLKGASTPSEQNSSQTGDSLTTSEDSDTVRIYDLNKQETRIIKDDVIKTPPNTPTRPTVLSLTPKAPAPTKVVTPTSLRFLQPKRKLFDPKLIMNDEDKLFDIVDGDLVQTPTNGIPEKPVIEEEVASSLPSVKALAKAFLLASSKTSSLSVTKPKSSSWQSTEFKSEAVVTEEEHQQPNTTDGPSPDSYSPPYQQRFCPISSENTTFIPENGNDNIDVIIETSDTPSSATVERPISPVLVPGLLKNNIAFFENLKNK